MELPNISEMVSTYFPFSLQRQKTLSWFCVGAGLVTNIPGALLSESRYRLVPELHICTESKPSISNSLGEV
jgi:hypothetical protein